MSASHSRAADSTSVFSTVWRSNVERPMTLSTSAVAVCCWRDSLSSLSRRAFSIAITACFAKVVNKLDLFVSERADFLTINDNRADQLVFLKHGYSDVRPRAAQSDHWI